jgi:hypothetical protein
LNISGMGREACSKVHSSVSCCVIMVKLRDSTAQQSVVRYCIASSKKDCIKSSFTCCRIARFFACRKQFDLHCPTPIFTRLAADHWLVFNHCIDGTYHLERVESSFDGQRHWILDSHSMLGGKMSSCTDQLR